MGLENAARRALAAAAFAIGLAAMPGLARAEFGKPIEISGPGEARQPHVAADASGNAVIVWRQADGENLLIQSRSRAADGTLGTIEPLSKAGEKSDAPQIGMSAAGDALVVWNTGQIQSRARSAAGVLGPIETLSKTNAAAPQVAMNSGGVALVVWRRFDSVIRIQARARSAGGGLGPIQTLSDDEHNADVPQVAINDLGDALVVWRHFDGTHWQVQARTRFASGRLGKVRTLSSAAEDAQAPHVALDAQGNALVAWQSLNGRIQASQGTLAGGFGAVETVSKGDPSFRAGSPVVALDGEGNGLIAWNRAVESLGGPIVEARVRSAAGDYGRIQKLSSTRGNVPSVAMQADGTAVVIWARFDGTVGRVEARTFSAGAFGSRQTLSSTRHNADATDVALAGDGRAIAVWERQDGPGDVQIEASVGP
jgi:hypothetical protein